MYDSASNDSISSGAVRAEVLLLDASKSVKVAEVIFEEVLVMLAVRERWPGVGVDGLFFKL